MGIVGKMLMVMVAIDVMLFIGGVNGGTDLLVFGDFLDVNLTTNATTNVTSGFVNVTGNLTTDLTPSPSSNLITQLADTFILPLFLVLNFLNLVVSVLFAPVTFLTAIGAPAQITILVGGTLMILYITGIISIIRGGDI